MPISIADFNKGKDPGSPESQIERILSDGQAYTAKEIGPKLWNEGTATTWDLFREFALGMRLEQMVKEKRIVSREIDGKMYYALR